MLRNLTFTIGGSFDYLTGGLGIDEDDRVSQFNPKIGISWEALLGTVFRAAIFRVVKRTLITDQTLEPTQVVGLNQFFDELNVTKSWRYGAAIDHQFTKNFFGGLEFSKRDLEVPVIRTLIIPPRTQVLDGKEYLSRAYLFWIPKTWVAMRTEYVFERFKNDRDLAEPTRLNTHRVPLGLSFFHPSGLSASLVATYYHQNGEFVRSSVCCESGSDSFWTINAALNYRFPKRYGLISLGVTNLADQKFKYFEVDRDNPSILPKRMFFLRLTLALP
jgi:outer membrane receptor protein involved in Fe transport